MKTLKQVIDDSPKSLHDCIMEMFEEPLNEMAISKSRYENLLHNHFYQIVENWCLSKYCTMFDKKNQNHKHWHRELASHVMAVNGYTLKSASKEKSTRIVLLTEMECSIPKNIYTYAYNKWTDEHFSLDLLTIIANEFVKELQSLIDILSETKTPEKAKNYCYSV